MLFNIIFFASLFFNSFSYYCGTNAHCNDFDSSNEIIISGPLNQGHYCGCKGNIWTNVEIQTDIPNYAFYENTRIQTVTLDTRCRIIGTQAFYGCTNLLITKIPDSITQIGSGAFQRCTSLTQITYETQSQISDFTFKDCSNLKTFSISSTSKNPITVQNNAFDGTALTSFPFDKIDPQGTGIFKSTKFTSVEIPSSWRSLNDALFESSTITSLTFQSPSSLQTIGIRSFSKCPLSSMNTLEIPSPVTRIFIEAFFQTRFQGELIIGSEVTLIGSSAFEDVPINKLTFADGSKLKIINQQAFQGCRLDGANLAFPNTIENIENYAFANTQILEVSNWPTSLITIGDYAFYESTLSGTITLPNELTSIGNYAFSKTQLSGSLSLNNKLQRIGDYAFQDTQINADLTKIPTSLIYFGKYAFEGTPTQKALLSDLMRIPDYYFAGDTIESLSFHTQLKSIGNHAFEKSILKCTSIIFPSSLSSIGTYAFSQATFTGDIEFSDGSSLTQIQSFTFYKVPFKTFKFPYKLSTIGDHAFQDSGTISWNDLPDTLTTIGDYAFENTKFTGTFSVGLENLISLTSIGKYAFNIKDNKISGRLNFSALKRRITLSENAFGVATFSDIIIDNAIIQGKAFQKVTIANSITIKGSYIDQDAFSYASFTNNMATFTIIDSTIYSYAVQGFRFNGGGTLKIKNCQTIGSNSFERILGKPNVVFELDEYKTYRPSIGEEAFYHSEIVGPLVIPDFITQVGKNAFSHCQYLNSSLILNATTVNDYSFSYSAFDGELTLGSNINSFSLNSRFHGFEGCKFNKLTIEPELAIRIPAGMFYQLRTIEGEVRFSEQISGIGEEAFFGCTGITSLVFDRNPQKSLEIGKSAFSGCSNIAGDIEIDRSVYYNTQTNQIIPEKAFYGCSSIHSIVLPNEITGISSGAFYGCSGLESINLPRSLTTLGSNAFYGCSNLNVDLVIPDGVTNVGSYAFYECKSLKSLAVGYGVTIINDYAFCRCGFRGDLIIPRVTIIGEGAFLGCESLNGKLELFNGFNGEPSTSSTITITVGKSAFEGCKNIVGPLDVSHIDAISQRAFRGCSSLTGELKFYPSLSAINNHIFDGCRSLTGSITWPTTSVSTIGEYAFNGCSGLSGDLNLPSSVIRVNQHAFHGCSGLTGPIVVPTTLNTIGKYAFAGCSRLSDSIKINVGGSTIIERNAFDGCTGFKDGTLTIFIENNEERGILTAEIADFYRYNYFLRIENEAFEDCKFKNIYFNGRFEPDCDYDIGIAGHKGIHTSSNYVNKSFCNNPIHHDNLTAGAIAGIVIACIVVVAAIAVLVVFLILRRRKNKPQSEEQYDTEQDI